MEGLTSLEWRENTLTTALVLAESLEWKTPLLLSIKIKPNILWSDGVPLTAFHFTNAWKRSLAKAPRELLKSLMCVRGFKSFFSGESTEIGGFASRAKDTLEVSLDHRCPFLPRIFAHPALWPLRLDIASPQSIVLGPYLRTEKGQNAWIYDRNPMYSGTRPLPDRIIAREIKDPLLRIQLFLSRELDIVDEIPLDLTQVLKASPYLKLFPQHRLEAILFPIHAPTLDKLSTRRAFQSAVDVAETLRLAGAPGFIPKEVSWPAPFLEASPRKRTQSQILSLVGFNNPPLALSQLEQARQLRLTFDTDRPERFAISENLEAQWQKKLGVNVASSEGPPLGAGMILTSLGWNVWTGDSLQYSALLDRLDPQRKVLKSEVLANEPTSPTERKEWERLLVEEEATLLPLYFPAHTVLQQPNVRGLTQNPIEIWDFRVTSKD